MKKNSKSFRFLLAFLFLGGLSLSCKDEEVVLSPTAKINSWTYEVMNEVYLWTDQMPGDPNLEQEPEDFYKGLLSVEDKFSRIVPNYQDLINSLNGISKEAGYDFTLFLASQDSDDVLAALTYVKNNSPASAAGLKRGDIVGKINGKQLTKSNYKELLKDLSFDHTLDFERYNESSGSYEAQPQLSLQVVELAEHPVLLDTVLNFGGKKVGYLVYNFFSPGTEGAYDQAVDQVMSRFQSEGITELVLDLRYNSGGSVASATNLASLLGKNIDDTKIFYENRWNELLQKHWEEDKNGEERLRKRFIAKSEKIGEYLSSGRLYVLTGDWTASASELVINGLRPYMDIFLIGDKTYGKNVASIPFEDKDNPENLYGILPIVLKIYNSEGKSDYGNGFEPNVQVDDLQLPMKALGDVEEPLLAEALGLITGSGARIAPPVESKYQVVKPVMSSIELKPRTNRLIMDKPEGLR